MINNRVRNNLKIKILSFILLLWVMLNGIHDVNIAVSCSACGVYITLFSVLIWRLVNVCTLVSVASPSTDVVPAFIVVVGWGNDGTDSVDDLFNLFSAFGDNETDCVK